MTTLICQFSERERTQKANNYVSVVILIPLQTKKKKFGEGVGAIRRNIRIIIHNNRHEFREVDVTDFMYGSQCMTPYRNRQATHRGPFDRDKSQNMHSIYGFSRSRIRRQRLVRNDPNGTKTTGRSWSKEMIGELNCSYQQLDSYHQLNQKSLKTLRQLRR